MNAQQNSSFPDYFSALKRRRLLLLGLALPILIVGLLLSVSLPDVYRSSALIDIQDENQRSEYLEQPQSRSEPSYADQYVQSLKETVLNDANLRRLLHSHDLYPDGNLEDADKVSQLRQDAGVKIVTVPILDPRTGREREIVTAFTVSYDNRIPKNAQIGARWLADEFLSANRAQHSQRATGASAFFGAEANRMGGHIAELEGKLADFKQKNIGKLPELAEVNMNSMDRTERDMEGIQLQMRTLRQDRIFLSAQLEQALAANPQGGNLGQLEEEYRRKSAQYDESHPDLISLRRQIDALRSGGEAAGASLPAQLEMKRAVLSQARQRYSDDHPDVKRLNREIDALQARIARGERTSVTAGQTPVTSQLRTQINAIDTQVAALSARSAELRNKMEQVEGNIVSAPQVEQEYQTLTRDLSIARTKYEELLKRQMDAQISEAAISGGRADDFRLVQPPLLPVQPSKPQRLALALISLILAVATAFTVTLVVEVFDPAVRGARDVREILQVSTLAAVPTIRNSISRRRQIKRAAAFAASLLIGISVAYYIIRTTIA